MGCLTDLINVLEQIRFDTMPNEPMERAKSCLADYLSIFECGKSMEPALQLKSALGGTDILERAEDLAYWMGGTTRLLDLDDGHRFAMGHPGVPILSAALATAAVLNKQASGTVFLESIVRAYETYCYIGRCVNPSAYLERGFDATCICGAPAAAVASGTILNLNSRQLGNAVAIAASLCGGLNQYVEDGSAPKYLCAGWGAKLGISAAVLAQNGLTGPEEIFEGRLGFAHGFAPKVNEQHMMNPQLRWEINLIYQKKFSCVRRIHTTLDCIEDIFGTEGLTYKDVSSVHVYGGSFIASAGSYSPRTEVKAQTCVPYTAALLMRYGAVTLDLIENNLEDKEIEALSRKVFVVEDEAFHQLTEKDPSLWGAVRIEVETADGKHFSRESHVAIGDPEKPFPQHMLQEKFMSLVTGVWSPDQANQIWGFIQTLETQQMSSLFKLQIF